MSSAQTNNLQKQKMKKSISKIARIISTDHYYFSMTYLLTYLHTYLPIAHF